MKHTRKILAALLVLMTILVSLVAVAIPASAEKIPGGLKLYLVPNANWNQSNARFAAYFFGDGEVWVSMTKVSGQSNLYEVTVPDGKNFTNVIFCRMNPSASANNWNNKWNQTSDLVYNGTSNCYTVKEGTWDKGAGTWSTYGSTCSHANLGPAATCTTAQECVDCGDPIVSALGHTFNSTHLCTRCNVQATFTVAGSGAHLGTEWDTGNTANDMTFADGVYTKVYTNVAAGTYKFKVARDHDWGTAYPSADKSYTVATSGSTVTITLAGTTVNVTVEAPHTHNFVEGKCECGEEDPNYVPPKTEVNVATLAELQAALADNTNDLPIVVTSMIEIPAGETVVLDLNGKTVAMEDSILTTAYALDNYGTLTLKDSKGNGSISARGIYNHGTMTVESGIYNAKGTDGGAAIFNYSVVYIYGGTFTSIGGYSLNNQSGASMTIGSAARSASTGATVTNGIYNTGATLTINNGNIANSNSGRHTIYAWNSNITINGGSLHNNNSGNSTVMAAGTSTVDINGGEFTINIVDASSSYLLDAQNTAIYEISGGTFVGGIRAQSGTTYNISGGTYANEYGNYNVYTGGNIDITGGTFNSEYAKNFASNNVADGYELKADGTVGEPAPTAVEVATLAELQAALADNTNDLPIVVTAEIQIPAGETVVLDLNGKTVTSVYQTGSTTKHIYPLNIYGNLTIDDTKGNGSITGRGIFVQSGCNLTVDGGSIYAIDSNGGSALFMYGGDVVINGGHIEQKAEGTYNFAIQAPAGSTVTVNGGWIGGNHGAIAVNGATVVVNGGELVCTGSESMTDNVMYVSAGSLVINGGTFTADGDIPSGGCCVYDAVGGATINGGTFGGSSGGDVWGTTGTTIKGGQFENLIETGHIAPGYEIGEDGKVVEIPSPYVAKIGETGYETLEDAFKAATAGCTIDILKDVVIDYKWDVRYTGAKFTVPVTINGNGHTLKFTGIVNDGYNYYSAFRFETDATVNNLTIDMSEAQSEFQGRFRAISAKANLTVADCTFIGSGSSNNTRAIIFGEGGTVDSLANVSINITGSTFEGWRQAIGDNETGKSQVKTIVIDNNTMTDAGVNVSASDTITFTNNTVSGKYVKLVSYAADNQLTVNASGNTLTENGADQNYTNAKVPNVQDEIVYPYVATINGVKYSTLKDAIKAVKEGETIIICDTVSEGSIKLPSSLKNVTFKGEGAVLKNMTIMSADGNSVKYEGITFDGIVFEGSNIVFTGARNGEVIYKNITITNCEFYNVVTNNTLSAVHFNLASDETIENLTFTNNIINGVSDDDGKHYPGGLRANYVSGNIVITGNNISNACNNAIQVINVTADNIVIENNVLASDLGGILNLYNVSAPEISITGNQFLLVEDQKPILYLTNVDVSGNYWNGELPSTLSDELICDYYYSELNSDGSINLGSKVIVPKLLGAGTETDPYVISSVEDLKLFRDSVNAGKTKYNADGVYVVLGADIDLAGEDWSVNIGDACNTTFDGIFDGKGHTIFNLTSTETEKSSDGYVCTGLFGAIYGNAVIKNLTIENVTINASFTGNNAAAVVGFVYAGKGSIENVTVCGNIAINAEGIYGVGAIIGYSYSSNIKVTDCKVIGNDGSYIKAASGAAAIAGYADGVHVENAEVSGLNISAAAIVGGITGTTLGTSINNVTIKNVSLAANGEKWVNSAAIVVGAVAANNVVIGNYTSENVSGANSYVGVKYTEKPTEVVPAIVAKINNTYYNSIEEAINAAQNGDVVTVLAGTYALPSMKAGLTLVGEGNVVFEGTLSGTLENLTLKNIHIKGANAQRWAYASGNNVFENVTFEATSVYALHFDGITAGTTLLYKNCTIIGWAAMSGSPESVTFDGCTFMGNGTYGIIRTYFDATIENCTFDVSNTNHNDNYQDGIHAVNSTVTVNGCTNVNGDMKEIVYTSTSSKAAYVVVDGVEVHTHNFVAGEVVAPTFDAEGYTVYNCLCGASENRDAVPALIAVAQIGDQRYTTLQEAVNAGGEIVLVKDIVLTETVVIPAGTTVVLNLNGKTVSMNHTEKVTKNHTMISNSGNLTINDTAALTRSGSAAGKISYIYSGENIGVSYSTNTITSNPGSTLTVNGGIIENNTYDSSVIAYAIDGLTNTDASNVTVTINGGTIVAKRQAIRIYANSTLGTGTLNVTGGDITGRVIVQSANTKANKAVLNISGGNFIPNEYKTEVLYVGGSTGENMVIDANVSGGKFIGDIVSSVPDGFISGGTYSSDVSEFAAEGFSIVQGVDENGNTIYGVVEKAALVPSIGANGNWFIGDVDTGVKAEGIDGANLTITNIEKTTNGNVDTYTITYSDNSELVITVTNGVDGLDGNGILAVFTEAGEKDGVAGQWLTISYTDTTKENTKVFIPNGKDGKDLTITNIVKTTAGLVDTYTITYSDNSELAITVTNGNGIKAIVSEAGEKDGVAGQWLTISYTDESMADTKVFIPDGKDAKELTITNVAKTTIGLVDTYTITFSDGTTLDLVVNNGNGIKAIVSEAGEKDGVAGQWLTISYTDESMADTKVFIPDGKDGKDLTITDIVKTTVGLVDTYTITFSDGKTLDLVVNNGNGIETIVSEAGEKDGVRGQWLTISYTDKSMADTKVFIPDGKDGEDLTITNISKVTNGNVDIYTITYSDGKTLEITVTNGSNGSDGSDGQDGATGPQGPAGETGPQGNSGLTPYIKEVDGVKYWFIGDVNTGVRVTGEDGADGNDNNIVVVAALAVATVSLIIAFAVLIYRGVKRRSWWA